MPALVFGKDFFGGCWLPFPEFDYTQYVPLCKTIWPLYFQRHILSCSFGKSGLSRSSKERQLAEITSKVSTATQKASKIDPPGKFCFSAKK